MGGQPLRVCHRQPVPLHRSFRPLVVQTIIDEPSSVLEFAVTYNTVGAAVYGMSKPSDGAPGIATVGCATVGAVG
jgi:hypothetical protein